MAAAEPGYRETYDEPGRASYRVEYFGRRQWADPTPRPQHRVAQRPAHPYRGRRSEDGASAVVGAPDSGRTQPGDPDRQPTWHWRSAALAQGFRRMVGDSGWSLAMGADRRKGHRSRQG